MASFVMGNKPLSRRKKSIIPGGVINKEEKFEDEGQKIAIA